MATAAATPGAGAVGGSAVVPAPSAPVSAPASAVAAAPATAKVKVNVKHFHQIHSWDCGLACAFMLCRFVGRGATYEQLKEAVEVSSVWTIDLAYMLYRIGVRGIRFYTTTLGVDAGYGAQSFYAREIANDTKRVTALFARAAARKDVHVQQRSLSAAEFDALFPLPPPPPPTTPDAPLSVPTAATPHLAIVLLDKNRIACTLCNASWYAGFFGTTSTAAPAPTATATATATAATPPSAQPPAAVIADSKHASATTATSAATAAPEGGAMSMSLPPGAAAVSAATDSSVAAPPPAIAPAKQPSPAHATAPAPASNSLFATLFQSCLRPATSSTSAAAAPASPRDDPYIGHYVLVVGRTHSGDYVFLDPNQDAAYCVMRAADLHRARTAYGTDEDLIVVDLHHLHAPASTAPSAADGKHSVVALGTAGAGRAGSNANFASPSSSSSSSSAAANGQSAVAGGGANGSSAGRTATGRTATGRTATGRTATGRTAMPQKRRTLPPLTAPRARTASTASTPSGTKRSRTGSVSAGAAAAKKPAAAAPTRVGKRPSGTQKSAPAPTRALALPALRVS